MSAASEPVGAAAPDGGFRHRALCYRSPTELLDGLAPRVAAAVEQGEPVSAVLDPASWEGLRERLGAAADSIARSDHAEVHGWSGQTWVDQLVQWLRGPAEAGRRLLVVGQHSAAFDGPDGAYWREIDAALNVALVGMPVTMLCLYPIDEVCAGIVSAVRWNHPELVVGAEVTPNPDAKSPAEALALTPTCPAPPLGPATVEVPFGPRGLHPVRTALLRQAHQAGLGSRRAHALVLAISELASNSIEHCAGHGSVRWWEYPERVIAEVHDPGSVGERLPGLRPPPPDGARGRGVYLARRLCDVVHLWSGTDGTHVRVEAER